MNVIDQHTSFQYDVNKEILMKRLADASQYKIYPSIIPKNELPLRKILLTTRLWNHVRRQQALMTIPSSANEWLFQQQDNTIILESEIKEQEEEDIPKNQYEWSWLDKEEKSSLSHEDTSSQDTSSFHNTASKKRVLNQEEETEDKEQVQIKKIKLHLNTIDSPAIPAGPDVTEATTTTTTTNNSPAVLLSA